MQALLQLPSTQIYVKVALTMGKVIVLMAGTSRVVLSAGMCGDHLHFSADCDVYHDCVLDVLVPKRCRSAPWLQAVMAKQLLLYTKNVGQSTAAALPKSLMCQNHVLPIAINIGFHSLTVNPQ